MHFKIGPQQYRLSIEPAPLMGEDGPTLGRVTHNSGNWAISQDVPPAGRLSMLLQLAEQTIHDHAMVAREVVCGQLANVVKALEAQGGCVRLMLMGTQEGFDPPRLADMTRSLTGQSAGATRQCGKCDHRFSPGQIALGAMRTDRHTRSSVVDLAAYCDFCEHVMRWSELANGAGRPGGVCVGEPRYARGEAVEAFIRSHPEKCEAQMMG